MQRFAPKKRLLALLVCGFTACDPSNFNDRKELADAEAGVDDSSDAGDAGDASDDAQVDLDAQSGDDAALDATFVDASDAAADASPDDGGDPVPSPDAGGDAGPPCGITRRLEVPRVTELARLGRPSVFHHSVLGPSARSGSTRTWILLGNTIAPNVMAPAAMPSNYPLVAYDGLDEPWKRDTALLTPWRLKEESTNSGLAPAMMTLRDGEPADLGLNPRSLIARVDGKRGSLAFVGESIGFGPTTKVWLADVEEGTHRATRRATPLFTEPPLFMHGARRDEDWVSAYACTEPPGTDASSCVVARAHIDGIADRASWEVRVRAPDGAWGWTDNLQAGTPVLTGVFLQLSITWNDFLRSFIAVYGEKLSNDAVLAVSPNPWGPWTEYARVPLPKPPVWSIMHVREHPSVGQRCESRIIISYFAPTEGPPDGLPTKGEVVLAAIDLGE